ncbi:MAG TPA: pantoate--beta-alanine ligase [Chroococcales cyanobacterium]
MTGTAATITRISDRAELQAWRQAMRAKNPRATIALVPTMGALHDGHLALVEAAKRSADKVIVSIFVNPLQFGPQEDFSRYPRTLDKDLELLSKAGADAVFHPEITVIYPHGDAEVTRVIPPAALTEKLCGRFRPGHFTGVATVVNILFNLVEPDKAFFGEKDYQQLAIIRKMVADLSMNVDVVGVPIVRESDGLAMSSRNVYLDPIQRNTAPKLQETLISVRDSLLREFDQKGTKGETAVEAILTAATAQLNSLPGVCVQYLECCDPVSLDAIVTPSLPFVLLVAAKLGDVRLIDNLIVTGK